MRRIAFAVSFAVGIFAACAHDEAAAPKAADAGIDSGLPPGVDHYDQLVACCSEDAGDCCTPGDMLCQPYRACETVGQSLPAKHAACDGCCAGLTTIELMVEDDAGACVRYRDSPTDLEPYLMCVACGDGLCDGSTGENRCTCPADCP